MRAAEKIRLAKQAPDKTIERKRDWLERQISPTFAQMFIASGYDQDFLTSFVELGLEKMNDMQLQQAEDYLRQKRFEHQMKIKKARESGIIK